MKVARAEDQQSRKKWVKRQSVIHSYGQDEDDVEDDEAIDQSTISETDALVRGGDDRNLTIVSGKTCRCGSQEHRRTSHKDCPLNKSKK